MNLGDEKGGRAGHPHRYGSGSVGSRALIARFSRSTSAPSRPLADVLPVFHEGRAVRRGYPLRRVRREP